MKIKKGTTLVALGALTLLTATAISAKFFLSEPQQAANSSAKPPAPAAKILKASTSGSQIAGNLLTINTGQLKHCNDNITLDEQALLSLPQQQFKTTHTWSENAEEFSGPLLNDVLNLACPDVAHLMLTAINDYSIEMNFNEMRNYKPIVALSVNGQRLSIRNKGPLWVMMPLDQFTELPPRSLDDMLIWQLSDITVLSTNEAS